jgi:hypothetical protein
VALPEAKLLRERATAARKLADTIRAALPSARDSGGRRRGAEPLPLEDLRQLAGKAEELRVHMPELLNLAAALERVDVWQVGRGERGGCGVAVLLAQGRGGLGWVFFVCAC